MELTPRTVVDPAVPVSPRPTRSRWSYAVLVGVLVGLGVVAYQGLTSASLYFYNADEAVAHRADLGAKRIRLQGLVLDDVTSTAAGVAFTVEFNGVEVPVRHAGDPPELFAPGRPVVLEGRWSSTGDAFDSDTILVKHSEQYTADNKARLDDAKAGRTKDGRTGDTSTP